MATSIVAIKWLDLLEKEFDKAFVELDTLLGEIDEDQCEVTYDGRQRLTTLSAAFAQLCHKAQTVFENNGKFEREAEELRQELCEARASRNVLEKELQHLLLQLHAAQLQVSAQMGKAEDSATIKQKLESEMERYRKDAQREAFLDAEGHQLKKENADLRRYVLSLQSELYGARLAAKYLDKELAGRIQQIQLLGRDIKGRDHDRLWNQLESEIHLHRHKTVIRACRGRLGTGPRLPFPPGHELECLRKSQGIGDVRVVHLVKEDNEGLGISITGGKEHGVPILISEIHPDMPAWRSGALFVGDAILSVNGVDLREARHNEAVQTLSNQIGEIDLEVIYVAPDEDTDSESQDLDVDHNFRYKFYDSEVMSQISLSEQDYDRFNFSNSNQDGSGSVSLDNLDQQQSSISKSNGVNHFSPSKENYNSDSINGFQPVNDLIPNRASSSGDGSAPTPPSS